MLFSKLYIHKVIAVHFGTGVYAVHFDTLVIVILFIQVSHINVTRRGSFI